MVLIHHLFIKNLQNGRGIKRDAVEFVSPQVTWASVVIKPHLGVDLRPKRFSGTNSNMLRVKIHTVTKSYLLTSTSKKITNVVVYSELIRKL